VRAPQKPVPKPTLCARRGDAARWGMGSSRREALALSPTDERPTATPHPPGRPGHDERAESGAAASPPKDKTRKGVAKVRARARAAAPRARSVHFSANNADR